MSIEYGVTLSAGSDGVVSKQVVIDAPADHVFDVFTRSFDLWWPRKNHLGASERFTAILEPWVGGRWYERGEDGSECDWGRVLAWEPPHRLLLSWQIDGDWRSDPDFVTEVEVRFYSETAHRTRVELEHRLLERYGDKLAAMRTALDSPNGWAGALAAMARLAEEMR